MTKARPTIHLFADVLGGYGGIETYLNALARRLAADGWPLRVWVSLNASAPFLGALEAVGIEVYRQPRVPGDRWLIRQRLLVRAVATAVRPGDWVFCVRQPMPELYLSLVRAVHRRGGKVAASWIFSPEFLPPSPDRVGQSFKAAVQETDAVISVAHCTTRQFGEIYGYDGPVHVVRYHNLEVFADVVPLPPHPPLAIAYMGRISIEQKNLDTILAAFCRLSARRPDVVLNIHGGGPDLERFRQMVGDTGLSELVVLHGAYDHRKDLPAIVAANHLFIYASRFEGGPCLALIELLQAGRYVVASSVGGIPDIYEGRPEIGALVPHDDVGAIADALDRALSLVERGAIDAQSIRACYREEFHDSVAHRQWLAALGLGDRTRHQIAINNLAAE